MSQYDVLLAVYDSCKEDTTRQFSSKEIYSEVQKRVDANEPSIRRGISSLVYWGFIKRSIEGFKWKDSYALTDRGVSTAQNLINIYKKS